MVAFLPVEVGGNLKGVKGAPPDKLAVSGNAVLDTLAGSKTGNMIGPSAVASLMGSRQVPTCLRWQSPAADLKRNASALFECQQLEQLLGTNRVVRTYITSDLFPGQGSSGGGTGFEIHWKGRIGLRMELIDLSSRTCIRAESTYGTHDLEAGMIFMLPFYYRETLGRGIDKAARAALQQLFQPPQDGN